MQLGLSKDLRDPTHPLPSAKLDPPPTKLTAPTVSDRFHSLKTQISGLDIGSPPLKSEKLKLVDPSIFSVRSCISGVFWDFLGKIQARSSEISLDIAEILPKMAKIWLDFCCFTNFSCCVSAVFIFSQPNTRRSPDHQPQPIRPTSVEASTRPIRSTTLANGRFKF